MSFIRRAGDLGFTVQQVRALLRLADDQNAPCSQVDDITSEHVAQIDRKIADLQALRTELEHRKLSGYEFANCRIIESLSPRLNDA
ncbi:MerR family DNA-binding protein [Sphingobium sp. JS3065]|uniref:MerR family DNA-binding protein n=1 Tax=Sphingobium sp. JS3065 TaxID=2970925 RepID=UPI002264AE6F|nr:MerR family DNA-binding protein [Sphingobium sp. JS3065]UZW54890.1 MerR family DNA-binding protein [Sphingobium sp. JS3065]